MELSNPKYPCITINPEICFGEPRIKGTRMPVSSILAYLGGGMAIEQFLNEFTWLTKADVEEAISFAAVMEF